MNKVNTIYVKVRDNISLAEVLYDNEIALSVKSAKGMLRNGIVTGETNNLLDEDYMLDSSFQGKKFKLVSGKELLII